MSLEDIEAMKEDYLESLQELTVPARPVINNLTDIARENTHAAQGIVKAIEEHLNKCPPTYKLPALYLMDSICKNVGSPYTTYFGLQLFKTFTKTYTLVGESVRRKMADMFETWKVPQPNSGKPLFSTEQIRKIDDFLGKVRETQQEEQRLKQTEQARSFLTSGPMSASALLVEVDKLIDLTAQRQRFDNTVEAGEQLAALTKLKELLSSSGIDAALLPRFQKELAGINQREVERLNQLTSRQSTPSLPFNIPHQQGSFMLPSMPPANTGLRGVDLSQLMPVMHSQQPQMPLFQQQQQQQQSQPQMQSTNRNPMDLFNGLKTLGVLGQFVGGAAVVEVELSNQGIQTARPQLIDRLYKNLSEQCNSCGKRFVNSAEGRKEKSAHLDWHFRTNKRLREDNRQQNRSWYQTLDDWVKWKDENDVLGLGGEDEAAESKTKKTKVSQEQLMQQCVPAPENKLGKVSCPICTEKLKTKWNDNTEEWVWTNAVKVGNKVFHATCRAEADDALIKRLIQPRHATPPGGGPARPTPPPSSTLGSSALASNPVNLSSLDLKSILANFQPAAAVKREHTPDEDTSFKKVKLEHA